MWVDGGVQRLAYYVSKSLHEAEVHAILAVVHATCKLHHYVQSHTIVVLTQLPLKSLLRSVDYIGRIAKGGTILRVLISNTCLAPLSKAKSSLI